MPSNQLTPEQRETVRELQEEIADLNLKADIEWAKYVHTKDVDCFREVQALESEIEMKGLISYIPKAGELKIGKVRKLITKAKKLGGQECEDCDLGEFEVRLTALESINEWRETLELPPLERLPRGVPGDKHECTLARALTASMNEAGYGGAIATVSANGIRVEGQGEDNYYEQYLTIGSSQGVIEQFDDNAWLDLLEDHSLYRYAADVASDWGAEASAERLQEISDEMRERGISESVSWGAIWLSPSEEIPEVMLGVLAAGPVSEHPGYQAYLKERDRLVPT